MIEDKLMGGQNFEWCFEIGQKVTDLEFDGVSSTDVLEITARLKDTDGEQFFDVRRITDNAVWELVPANLLEGTMV